MEKREFSEETQEWLRQQEESDAAVKFLMEREAEKKGYGQLLLGLLESKVKLQEKFPEEDSEGRVQGARLLALVATLDIKRLGVDGKKVNKDLRELEKLATAVVKRVEEDGRE